MKPFWKVRGGVIGTAHLSRDFRIVDFRPYSGAYAQQYVHNQWHVFLYPARGVPIEQLHVGPEGCSVDRETVLRVNGESSITVEKQIRAEWRSLAGVVGVARCAATQDILFYGPRRVDMEWELASQKACAILEALSETLPNVRKVLELAKPTHKEIGRYQSTRPHVVHNVHREMLLRAAKAIDPRIEWHGLRGGVFCTAEETLAEIEARRLARKEKWLSSHG